MIKQILYPFIQVEVLRMDMTPEEVERFEQLTSEEKAEFIYRNTGKDKFCSTYKNLIIDFYDAGLDKMELQKGICRVCGCTDFDACLHPELGECFWVDENHDLCSHCEDADIAKDVKREGPQGVIKPFF